MNASDLSGFDKIIGHDLAKRMIIHSVNQGMPSQALIIAGMESIGKLTLAMEYARALSCENRSGGEACGLCAICRAIDNGNYPDIRVFPPDKANTTSIESMRIMRDISRIHPMRGKWKINIVEQADTLNEESANCILKLLEEPPSYVVNILLYRNETAALSTIRSRCRLLRLFQVPNDLLASRLIEDFGASSEQAEFLALYSQGCPGLAITLMHDNQFQSDRDAIIQTAAEVVRNGTKSFLLLAEKLRVGSSANDEDSMENESGTNLNTYAKRERAKGREAVIASLDTMLVWFRDLLAAFIQGESASIVNADRKDEVFKQARFYRNSLALQIIIEQIITTRKRILANANPQIQTEALMAMLATVAQGGR